MADEIKKQMIYLVSVDVLKRLIKKGINRDILERLNKRNADKMNCAVIEIA